jgi:predicted aspartyl protease
MRSPLARAARGATLVVCLAACGALASRAQNIQPQAQVPPADVLTTQGLSRQGSTWVLETEALPLKAYKEVRALAARVKSGETQLRDFEANQDPKVLANNYRTQANMLNPQIAMFNQQLAQYGGSRGSRATSMYRNQVNQQLNMVKQEQQRLNAMANNLNSQAPQFEQQKKELAAEVEKARASFEEAKDKLSESVKKVMSKYAELAKDEPVVVALANLSTAAKVKQKLGPSKEFASMLKVIGLPALETEIVDLRRESGVDRIDAQLSGSGTLSMVLDPTAEQVILPARLASKLALKSTNRTVEWKAADGKSVTVPEMTIPSVRVGRMTARDVACAVVPAEQGDVAPVLGRSFLQQFDSKHLPTAGKLVLIKGEAEPAAEKSEAAAEKPKSSER